MGLGELATPRWARGERDHREEVGMMMMMADDDNDNDDSERQKRVDCDEFGESEERVNGHAIGDDDYDKDFRDSPWTIEALDDEPEVKEEVRVRF